MRCERCGEDALDPRGICQACGWRAPGNRGTRDDVSAPSLGETRAADVPASAPPTSAPATGRQTMAGGAATGAPPYPSGSGLHGTSGTRAQMTGVRYCGVCGARLEGQEVFCGQCGAPAGTTAIPTYETVRSSAPDRYAMGQANGWQSEEYNAPTEFIPDMAPGRDVYSRGGSRIDSGGAYPPGAYGPGSGAPQAAPASSARTAKIVFGVLCLLGSLGSAAAAIVIALQP